MYEIIRSCIIEYFGLNYVPQTVTELIQWIIVVTLCIIIVISVIKMFFFIVKQLMTGKI